MKMSNTPTRSSFPRESIIDLTNEMIWPKTNEMVWPKDKTLWVTDYFDWQRKEPSGHYLRGRGKVLITELGLECLLEKYTRRKQSYKKFRISELSQAKKWIVDSSS